MWLCTVQKVLEVVLRLGVLLDAAVGVGEHGDEQVDEHDIGEQDVGPHQVQRHWDVGELADLQISEHRPQRQHREGQVGVVGGAAAQLSVAVPMRDQGGLVRAGGAREAEEGGGEADV